MKVEGMIKTAHSDAQSTEKALKIDNLSSMNTRVEGNCVIFEIESEKIRSVTASVDDYLMNLQVASEMTDLKGSKSEGRKDI